MIGKCISIDQIGNIFFMTNSSHLYQITRANEIGKEITSNTESTKSSDKNGVERRTILPKISKFKKSRDKLNKAIDLQRNILVERKILGPLEAKKV